LHGIAATARHFQKKGLKDSTIQDWRNLHKKEYHEKCKEAKPKARADEDVSEVEAQVEGTELPSK